jgi:hypothetical protein
MSFQMDIVVKAWELLVLEFDMICREELTVVWATNIVLLLSNFRLPWEGNCQLHVQLPDIPLLSL